MSVETSITPNEPVLVLFIETVMIRHLAIAVVLACCIAPAGAEQLFKWVDDNGVVHYGDAVPAEASRQERHVLNEQGVTLRVLQRAKTREEIAAMADAQAEIERQRRHEVVQAERDRILLDTYLSEDEIEMLRDRRILALEARIGLTRHYLDNLRMRWDELEAEASRYNFPYQVDSELPPLPEDLAQDIVFTENAMTEHMETLGDLRTQQGEIRNEFQKDIERFRALKAAEAAEEVVSQTPR